MMWPFKKRESNNEVLFLSFGIISTLDDTYFVKYHGSKCSLTPKQKAGLVEALREAAENLVPTK